MGSGKFNIGDRVKCIDNFTSTVESTTNGAWDINKIWLSTLRKNSVYTVIDVDIERSCITINAEDVINGIWFNNYRFEKYNPNLDLVKFDNYLTIFTNKLIQSIENE